MATRASKTAAKKTATQPAAKKTATKQATPPARTPRKRTPRTQASTALTLVKPADTTAETDTQVDTRPRLAVRRRLFVGPMGPHEQAAIRAALAAAALRLPISVRSWNGSQAQLADGTLLIHNPGPDPDHADHTAHRVFTAHIACRHGATHGYPIANYADLVVARDTAEACDSRHSEPTADDNDIHEYDWDKAITRGVAPTAKPKPSAVFQLREGVRRATAAADKTQPLDQNEIAEGLAARAAHQSADNDETREHPQP